MHLKQELSITILVSLVLLFLVDPFGLMPDAVIMGLLAGLVVLIALFVGFVWREKPQDEREALHRMFAGRIAFLSGSVVLLVGIVIQTFAHELDFWLPLTLGIMVIAKVAASAHGRNNQ